MIKVQHAHAMRLIFPNLGVADTGALVGQFHFGIEINAVSSWQFDCDTPTETGLVTGGINRPGLQAERFGLFFEVSQCLGGIDFESHVIHTGIFGLSKSETVMIEFVIGFEHDTSVFGTSHF
ncbi:hypothetical protein DSECCO2_659440 [anaerobic digester metagenome]